MCNRFYRGFLLLLLMTTVIGCRHDYRADIKKELEAADLYSFSTEIDSLTTSWHHFYTADSLREKFFYNEQLSPVIPRRVLATSDEQFDALIEMDDMLDAAAMYCDLSTAVREHMHWYEAKVVTVLPGHEEDATSTSQQVIEITDKVQIATPKDVTQKTVKVQEVDPNEEQRKAEEQRALLADKYYQQGQSAEYLCNEYDDEDECARMEHSYNRAAFYNPGKYAYLLN